MDEILQLKNIVKLYQHHHAHCNVISQESRNLVDQTLRDVSTTCQFQSPSLGQQQDEETTSITSGLLVIPFDASSLNETKKRRRSSIGNRPTKKTTTEWRATDHSFVQDVPTAEKWNTTLKELVTKSPKQDDSIARPIVQVLQPTCNHTRDSTVIKRGISYAKRSISLMKEASFTSARARIYLLCFLSYCFALEKLKILPVEDINKVMSELIGGKSAQYLKRIRDGAQWMNKEGLVKTGWTESQATLLLEFCGPLRPYAYAKIQHIESVKYIILGVTTRQYLLSSDATDIRISVPELILDWDPAFDLEKLRGALRYPDQQTLTSPTWISRSPPNLLLSEERVPTQERQTVSIADKAGRTQEQGQEGNLKPSNPSDARANYQSPSVVPVESRCILDRNTFHQAESPDTGVSSIIQDGKDDVANLSPGTIELTQGNSNVGLNQLDERTAGESVNPRPEREGGAEDYTAIQSSHHPPENSTPDQQWPSLNCSMNGIERHSGPSGSRINHPSPPPLDTHPPHRVDATLHAVSLQHSPPQLSQTTDSEFTYVKMILNHLDEEDLIAMDIDRDLWNR